MAMNQKLLRPKASGFNPKSIAGLYAWYDAADSAAVTLNGTTVSEWRDKSGGGRHVSQGTALSQPTYTTAGQNGKNCLTFSSAGSGKRLAAATASDWAFLHDGLSLYAMFVVASSSGSSGIGAVHTYVSTRGSYNTYNVRGFDMAHDYGGVAANNNIRVSISGTAGMVGRRDMSATGLDVVRCYSILGDPANATSTARLAFTHSASGTSSATSSVNTAQTGDPAGVLNIGNNATGAAFPHGGKICEILFYNRAAAVTSTESAAIVAYLTKKWGI